MHQGLIDGAQAGAVAVGHGGGREPDHDRLGRRVADVFDNTLLPAKPDVGLVNDDEGIFLVQPLMSLVPCLLGGHDKLIRCIKLMPRHEDGGS